MVTSPDIVPVDLIPRTLVIDHDIHNRKFKRQGEDVPLSTVALIESSQCEYTRGVFQIYHNLMNKKRQIPMDESLSTQAEHHKPCLFKSRLRTRLAEENGNQPVGNLGVNN